MSEARGGLHRRLVGGVLLLGLILRLRQFIDARPLWLDEAMLTLNILTRSFAGLLLPLDQDQTAPVPFLWGQKALTLAAGPHELVLRIIPLLAGVGFLLVLWRLAERLLPPGPVLLALLLAALSPLLIQYSNEAKPYGVDAFLACGMLLLALRLLERPQAPRFWWTLGIAGTLVATASATAMFTLAAVLVALGVSLRARAQPGGWIRLAVLGVCWGVVCTLVYFAVYHAPADSAYMKRYWIPSFVGPLGAGMAARIQHIASSTLVAFFTAEGGIWRERAALLLLIPLILGVVRLLRERGFSTAALVVIPLLSVIFASTLRAYPIAPRLVLFGSAPIVLLVAGGFGELADRAHRAISAPWLPLFGSAVLVLSGLDAARQLVSPERKEDLARLIADFQAQHAPAAAVYVSARAIPAWLFYTTDWKHAPDSARIETLGTLVSSKGPAFRHAPTRGRPVGKEGDDLIYDYRDWTELIGVPTGQGPNERGENTRSPDIGWAGNEVRRLKAAGRSDNWIVLSSFAATVPIALRKAVQQAGGQFTLWEERQGAVVARVRF